MLRLKQTLRLLRRIWRLKNELGFTLLSVLRVTESELRYYAELDREAERRKEVHSLSRQPSHHIY